MAYDQNEGKLSRRKFIASGLAAAGSLYFAVDAQGKSLLAGARAIGRGRANFKALKSKFGVKGTVLTPADAGFKDAAFGELWNKLQPTRHPEVIVQVEDAQDVAAAIKFARAHKMKVNVRGGGHNWALTSLRDNGVLIDLSKMNKVVSIDPVAAKAVVQPIISNRQVQEALNAQGLSFPSGHCPQVKISGYLLSGGMAWNHGSWGPGVGSIEAIEIVNAQGEMLTASTTENSDYFWAARGGASMFFGVATAYHLKLYPLPKAITASVYYYPYEDIVELAAWLGPFANVMPPSVELSLFAVTAPPELAEASKSSNGKVALVTATMFTDSPEDARGALVALDSCPLLDKCLKKSLVQPTDFPALFDASGSLWPEGLRSKVDACFSNTPLVEIIKATKDHFKNAPSPKTVYMYAVFTGPNGPPKTPADASFCMTGNLYGGPWTMWESAEHDAENIAWHNKCMELLAPYLVGHYVSEADTSEHPAYVKKSYSADNLKRLEELKRKYDPQDVFFTFTGGLS